MGSQRISEADVSDRLEGKPIIGAWVDGINRLKDDAVIVVTAHVVVPAYGFHSPEVYAAEIQDALTDLDIKGDLRDYTLRFTTARVVEDGDGS